MRVISAMRGVSRRRFLSSSSSSSSASLSSVVFRSGCARFFDPRSLTDFPWETTDYFESTLCDASTHREISVSDNLIRRESGTKRFLHGRCFRSRSSFCLPLSLSLFLSHSHLAIPVSSNRLSAMSTRSSARPLSTFIHVSFSAQLRFLPRTFRGRVLLSAFTLKSWKAIIE